MDKIIVKCPHCQLDIEAETEWIGMNAVCPGCQKEFEIKTPELEKTPKKMLISVPAQTTTPEAPEAPETPDELVPQTFTFVCPACGKPAELPGNMLGQTYTCEDCCEESIARETTEKQCPFCSNTIKYKATFCKFCKKNLINAPQNTIPAAEKTFPFICPSCSTFAELPLSMEGKEYECKSCCETAVAKPAEERQCPFCGETVKIHAAICKSCRKQLPPLRSKPADLNSYMQEWINKLLPGFGSTNIDSSRQLLRKWGKIFTEQRNSMRDRNKKTVSSDTDATAAATQSAVAAPPQSAKQKKTLNVWRILIQVIIITAALTFFTAPKISCDNDHGSRETSGSHTAPVASSPVTDTTKQDTQEDQLLKLADNLCRNNGVEVPPENLELKDFLLAVHSHCSNYLNKNFDGQFLACAYLYSCSRKMKAYLLAIMYGQELTDQLQHAILEHLVFWCRNYKKLNNAVKSGQENSSGEILDIREKNLLLYKKISTVYQTMLNKTSQ